MGPQTIGLALLLALLVLVPTRRLSRGGAPPGALAAYFIGLWLVSFIVVLGGAPRILVPVLLIVYLAPFVTLGAGLAALRQRFGFDPRPDREPQPPAMKDVTPRDEAPPPAMKDVTPRDEAPPPA
ncbi:MAG: hypothetical protein L0221_12475 [Chloroflexi bacterium]|nr:hypothetical protein [Chloroflexota bacterium]